ncbi:MAG: [Fe-S]-binding protein, partial [bacterium]|nr:[Fe-S]-binding protein [bacterium]
MSYPRMIRIQQHLNTSCITDVAQVVRAELSKIDLSRYIKPGDTVAISAGSRGIANIASITKTLVEELKKYGAEPFIVPAMGSHGGGTAEGQRAIIEGYGITEEYVDAPIKA